MIGAIGEFFEHGQMANTATGTGRNACQGNGKTAVAIAVGVGVLIPKKLCNI